MALPSASARVLALVSQGSAGRGRAWFQSHAAPSGRSDGTNASSATRLECRVPGADANPHLALAVSLASGLYGISERLEPPDAVTGNAYEDAALPTLPSNLDHATSELATNNILRDLLGSTFVDHYVMTRDYEVRRYERAVTDWELRRYFEVI